MIVAKYNRTVATKPVIPIIDNNNKGNHIPDVTTASTPAIIRIS